MASPAQTVIGKGKPNPLIAGGWLKTPREQTLPLPSSQILMQWSREPGYEHACSGITVPYSLMMQQRGSYCGEISLRAKQRFHKDKSLHLTQSLEAVDKTQQK